MGSISSQVSFLNNLFTTPLVGSSGTVGYGIDFLDIQPSVASDFFGGLTLKTITPNSLEGNSSPRVCETEYGFINSIGLQNCGLNAFCKKIHPRLAQLKPKTIVSVAAFTVKDFAMMVNKVSQLENIDMIELNVSCPNTDYHGKSFFSDEVLFQEVIDACSRQKNYLPLLVKLAPLNNQVVKMAEIAERFGADALTVSNTFNGMKIDVHNRIPMIAQGIGGYSGPAIKPIVLALVHQITQSVSLPVIGVGGVITGEDVIEYLLAGASLVGIGTANFTDPRGAYCIWKQFKNYLQKYGVNASQLIGAMRKYPLLS